MMPSPVESLTVSLLKVPCLAGRSSHSKVPVRLVFVGAGSHCFECGGRDFSGRVCGSAMSVAPSFAGAIFLPMVGTGVHGSEAIASGLHDGVRGGLVVAVWRVLQGTLCGALSSSLFALTCGAIFLYPPPQSACRRVRFARRARC